LSQNCDAHTLRGARCQHSLPVEMPRSEDGALVSVPVVEAGKSTSRRHQIYHPTSSTWLEFCSKCLREHIFVAPSPAYLIVAVFRRKVETDLWNHCSICLYQSLILILSLSMLCLSSKVTLITQLAEAQFDCTV